LTTEKAADLISAAPQNICGFSWWRWRESNPCPKTYPHDLLRA